jgi:hypothetical protein
LSDLASLSSFVTIRQSLGPSSPSSQCTSVAAGTALLLGVDLGGTRRVQRVALTGVVLLVCGASCISYNHLRPSYGISA